MSAGGGGGEQSSTTTTVRELSPQQQSLLDLAIPRAEKFGEQGLTLPQESGVAGFDPLQLQAQESALQQAQPGGALANTVGNATLAQNFALGPLLFPETNPALRQATDAAIRPLTEQFTESVLPQIRGGAIAANQPGGSRQGVAEGIASRGFLRQVGDTSANIQSDAYQQGLDAFIKGLALAPQTAGLQTLPSSILDIIGGQRQGQEQQRLTEEQTKFFNTQLLDLTVAQELAKLAGTFGGGSTIATATQPNQAGGSSAFNRALGGASAGFGLSGGNPFGAAIGGIGSLIFG